MTIVFYWPNRRRKDPDNYAKVLCDALTHAGLIVDDSPAWAEIATRFADPAFRERLRAARGLTGLRRLLLAATPAADAA